MKVYLMVSTILVVVLFSLIWLYVLFFPAVEMVPSSPAVWEPGMTETSSAMVPGSLQSR
ncbi:hypothetical protein Tnap_0976 [Thermotoga petrophila RKU-10]|uniref:Uncharacterized protein n=1 Tax=Thermotoga petrophila (strain ATCC BAA-489 / DSM 13996 / JCM 10882 / RKU-10) TaxID=590168 RepID=D2C7X9_THEP2|nr:hypothetical protein [Thermotoga petrophila]ADA67065.1 hypothetical protein Tnap_0976 [Thermotoga petrophila RKU-10]